ncbi:hypothetical protein ACJ7K1_03740 [Paenibacillus elgii]
MEESTYDNNGNLITRAKNKFSNLNGRWSEIGEAWKSIGEGKQGEVYVSGQFGVNVYNGKAIFSGVVKSN